jgi:predicted DNA-binding transcriptional regulator YafY
VARNAELVRQWEILRAIDSARTGISVAKLADERSVHPRTIRRDIDALCRAGFPLFDDKVNGTPLWRLGARPFRCLEDNGLGLHELAALYFGNTVLSNAATSAFDNEGERALMKIRRAVPQPTRELLDSLPRILTAKRTGRKKQDERRVREITSRVLDAITRKRAVLMRYASRTSARTKEYAIEPQRLSCADGGMYLIAWVPEYRQLRTFALERIETLAVQDERFEPRPLPAEPFTNSLGVHTGPAMRVVIEFSREAAPYVAEREWHRSQQLCWRADGSLVLELEVCVDHPLKRWILGYGSDARVLAPAALVDEITDLLKRARDVYAKPAAAWTRATAKPVPVGEPVPAEMAS